MKIELTRDENVALVELIRNDLEYFHETLRNEHKTVASAMDVFDACHEVALLKKLSSMNYQELRKYVEEYLKEYLD